MIVPCKGWKIRLQFLRFTFLSFLGFIIWCGSCLALEENTSPWLKLAERGRIELWAQPSSGLIKIVDQKIGFTWESGGLAAKRSASVGNWQDIVSQSVFILRYLNDSGNIETIFTGQPECKKRFIPIKAGGSFSFSFQDCNISFQAVYTLGVDNNLRIIIPFRKIIDPKNRLLDIRVLPYFGSLTPQSGGFLVMPDGCGGLIKPRQFAQDYVPERIYGKRFYFNKQIVNGQSNRFLNLSDYYNRQNDFLSLPIFGVIKGKGGFLGIIAQGRFQAELGVEVTPVSLESAVSPRLIIREIDYNILGCLCSSPVFDRKDRIVEYYFLADSEATYVGIAQKYRRILFDSLPYPRLKPAQTEFRLRLFMGVNEEYLDTRRLIRLTGFKQAGDIIKDLFNKNVRHFQVILVGWANRGYLGDNPRHFPADRRLGGNNGLKKLLETGEQLGISIGLQFDNSYTFKKSHGFKRNDTVKDIQGAPVDIGFGKKEYLFCPQLAWNRFLKKDLSTLRKLNCNGSLLFDGFNQGLFNCFDIRHPVGYESMATLIKDSFREVSQTNPVAVTAASDFLYSNGIALYDLPAYSSANCDQSVPLIPIICHGWLPYSFEPINLRSDIRRGFLKMVEYGAVPNAYLTAESVAKLANARHNPIFSGKYTDWRERIINEYHRYERDLRVLQTRAITDHQCLARDVYLTAYDDGCKTIVNYGLTDYSFNGAIVPALDFVIVR